MLDSLWISRGRPLRWNPSVRLFVHPQQMEEHFNWAWVEAQAAQSSAAWKACAQRSLPALPRSTRNEQRAHEKAYDQSLRAVEREARRARSNPRPRTRLAGARAARFGDG